MTFIKCFKKLEGEEEEEEEEEEEPLCKSHAYVGSKNHPVHQE